MKILKLLIQFVPSEPIIAFSGVFLIKSEQVVLPTV